MVPLYDARVSDLNSGDAIIVECAACGHTTAIPPSGLLQGLRLPPTTKIVDLAPRMRCRACDARGRAVVSVKWAANRDVMENLPARHLLPPELPKLPNQ